MNKQDSYVWDYTYKNNFDYYLGYMKTDSLTFYLNEWAKVDATIWRLGEKIHQTRPNTVYSLK